MVECFWMWRDEILNQPGDSSGESERDENEDDAEREEEKPKDTYLQLLKYKQRFIITVHHVYYWRRAVLSFIAISWALDSISIFKGVYLHSSKVKLVNKWIAGIDEFSVAFLQRNWCLFLWWRHSGSTFHPAGGVKVTPCTLTPKLQTIPPTLLSVAPRSKRPGERFAQFWRGKIFLRWCKQQWWQVSSFSELKLFRSARPGSTTIAANAR